MTHRHLKTITLLPGHWIRTPVMLGNKRQRFSIPAKEREAASRKRQALYQKENRP